jgi:hypothetical protein
MPVKSWSRRKELEQVIFEASILIKQVYLIQILFTIYYYLQLFKYYYY